MNDDELELAILRRYVEQHAIAGTKDPENSDKCLRELDMREVLSSLTPFEGPRLDYEAQRWLMKLAPPSAGGFSGPLKSCGKNLGEHRHHARAFLVRSGPNAISAWDRIAELERAMRTASSVASAPSAPVLQPLAEGAEMKRSPVRLFISHSSEDRDLAERLTELLAAALTLPSEAILCTSVDGHRLEGGVNTNERLRREINDAEAFVGLISPASLRSLYVAFELGGRWALGKHLVPLLAPGTPPSALEGPLAGINSLRADSRAQLHQLVEEIGKLLKVGMGRAAAYEKYIDAIVEMPLPKRSVGTRAARSRVTADERAWIESLGDAARELLVAAANSDDGMIAVFETAGGVYVQVKDRNFTEPKSPRSVAKWRGGIHELVEFGCVEGLGANQNFASYSVSDHGFKVVDALERLREEPEAH